MTLRPRFFLLAVPIVMLCFVHGLWTVVDAVGRRVAASGRAVALAKSVGLAVLTVTSLLALVPYYRVPKQSYRATIAFLEETRRPGEAVIVWGNAESGLRFYGNRAGLADNRDYVYLRDPGLVDSLLASRVDRATYLVFTLSRDVRLTNPEFAERLQREWTKVRVFPATVGDGAITVLRRARRDGA